MNDPGAGFNEFYAANYRQTVAQIYALTGSLSAAEDASQEGYVRAWSRWAQISRYDNPAAWVYLIGSRIAISHWRQLSRAADARRSRPERETTVSAPSENTVLLVAGLRQLPMEQRQALVLHYLVGLSVDEIAAQEGRPAGTIKARLSRGRTALAEALGTESSIQPREVGNHD